MAGFALKLALPTRIFCSYGPEIEFAPLRRHCRNAVTSRFPEERASRNRHRKLGAGNRLV